MTVQAADEQWKTAISDLKAMEVTFGYGLWKMIAIEYW